MASHFNSRPLVLISGTVVYIALTLFALRAILGGDMVKFAFVLFMPLVLMFGSMRQFWAGTFLGCLSLWTLGNFKFPLFGSIGVGGMIQLLIMGFLLLDIAMRKSQIFYRWRGYYALFVITAVLMGARILYDRPGMANLGSDQGGLASAMNYLFAVIAFGVAYYTARFQTTWKFTFRLLMLWSIGAYLLGDILLSRGVYGQNLESTAQLYGLTYTRSLYLLFTGLMILSLSPKALQKYSSVAFAFVILLLLAFAGMSSVRSTIFQTGAMVAMAGLLFNRFITGIGVFLFAGTVALVTLVSSVPYHQLPENVRRPISVFYTEGRDDTKGYGTKDEFRDALNRQARKQIENNPIFGKGWGFDLSEVLSEMSQEVASADGGSLAMTASFHNAFLTVAVNNGLPTALILLLALGSAGLSLFKFARKETDFATKQAISFMLVYCSSMGVMIWVNGGSSELRCLAVALGLASAYRDIREKELKDMAKRDTAGMAVANPSMNKSAPEAVLL